MPAETKKLNRKGRKEKPQRTRKNRPSATFSEMVNHTRADKNIMLAAFSDVHVQLGHARVEVARFAAQAEAAEQFDIESHADLKDCGRVTGFAGIGSTKLQCGIRLEIPKASPRAHPGRDSAVRKQVGAQRGRNDERLVVPRN